MIPLDPARLEMAAPGDRYADYCLWDYEPVGPTAGRLRQSSLLWHSLACAGADPQLFAICDALRDGLGPGRSVWGAKRRDGVTTWEFYFYDYARLERAVSIERVLAILAPFALCGLGYAGTRPYFMFSLDLDDALAREGATVVIGYHQGRDRAQALREELPGSHHTLQLSLQDEASHATAAPAFRAAAQRGAGCAGCAR